MPGGWDASAVLGALEAEDLEKTVERRPAPSVVRRVERRPEPNATQEVDGADVLEMLAIDQSPSSMIPVALDVAHRPSVSPPPEPGAILGHGTSRVRPQWPLFAGGLAALVLVGVAAFARSPSAVNVTSSSSLAGDARDTSSPQVVAAASPDRAEVAGDDAKRDGVPIVSVLSLPRVVPTTGTIRLIESAATHRLFIDGVPRSGPSAEVTCGKHMVQVGSAGHAHALMIGCGEETVIAR